MTSFTDLSQESAEEGEESLEQAEESVEEEEARKQLLKVASGSRPRAVAGAIAGLIREGRLPEVQAIGPRAVNQAIKAVAIARIFLAEEEIDIVCIPALVEIVLEGEERTAIKLTVAPP